MRLITRREAETILGVSRQTIQRMIHAGELVPVAEPEGPTGKIVMRWFSEPEVKALARRRETAQTT